MQLIFILSSKNKEFEFISANNMIQPVNIYVDKKDICSKYCDKPCK